MKKAYYKKVFLYNIFAVCLILFNISCGLDTFYVIEEPRNTSQIPQYNSIEPESRYFELYTNETSDISGLNFLGTDVYYKIYDNYSKLSSEVSSINAIVNDTEKNSNSASTLIDNYKYQKLTYPNNTSLVLIPSNNENRKVKIRLTDYGTSYASEITFSGNTYKPIRYVKSDNNYLTFNFGRNGVNDKRPLKGDADFLASDSSDGKYYVAMFAVGVGEDAAYTQYYSNLLFMGEVTIDANSVDN